MSVHNRLASESIEADLDVHCSSCSEAEPEKVVLRAESPTLASAFALSTSFEEDVLDLKWRQSPRALLCPNTPVLSPRFDCFGWFAFKLLFVEFFHFLLFISLYLGSPHSSDKMGAVRVRRCVCVREEVPQPLCVGCLCCPAANNPKRQWGCLRCRGLFGVLQQPWDNVEVMITVWSQTTNWM